MDKNWSVTVSGMSCEHCVKRVSKALAEIDGVTRVDVNLATGLAQVTYDDAKVRPDQLSAAVVEAGYEVAL